MAARKKGSKAKRGKKKSTRRVKRKRRVMRGDPTSPGGGKD